MTAVLADSPVWVAHFRKSNPLLQSLLYADQVLCHPLIVLELACGTPPAPRERTLAALRKLRQVAISTVDETLKLIELEQLHNLGCGAVDISLLASVLLTPDTLIWTVDRNLETLACRCGVAFDAAN